MLKDFKESLRLVRANIDGNIEDGLGVALLNILDKDAFRALKRQGIKEKLFLLKSYFFRKDILFGVLEEVIAVRQ